MKKAKCKIVSIALYPLRIAEEGHLRKHSSIGLSVQKKYRKDEPETKETGSLQRVGGKGLERMGKWKWNEVARMRRRYSSGSIYIALTLRTMIIFYLLEK